MRRTVRRGMVLVAAAALGIPGGVAGQDLARRIRDATGERIAFSFAVRDDVQVCDHGIRSRDGNSRWSWSGDRDNVCDDGPLRVELRREGGRITDLDLERAGAGPASGTDLGEVDPREAADFLLGLARSDAATRAARDGLMASTLAKDVDVAPDLLALARDRDLDADVRKNALFWVAQVASSRIGPELAGIAAAEAEDQEVRDAAVFALSQRDSDESVPALMDLARSAPHAKTRKSALFWLAQSDDPRVPDFFAELILGDAGG